MGSDQVSPDGGALGALAPLKNGFSVPGEDLGGLLESLGIKLFVRERSLAQYVSWSIRTCLIDFLDQHGPSDLNQVVEGTALTEAGADSLLGVLSALGFLSRQKSGTYSLSSLAQTYLLERSPYCISTQIEARGFSIPRPYLRGRSALLTALKLRILGLMPSIRYGSLSRLVNQHARNLCACTAAVRTGEFAGVNTMVDLAGGSGTFSIPLSLDYPRMRIILVDLSESLPGARSVLAAHGLVERVELQALNALRSPWRLPEYDGMFVGNFLHGFDDSVCLEILKEAYCHLQIGGQIWIHEMLWHETRDGPLITALWHAAMRSAGPGRQRTGGEFCKLLESAGFANIRTIRTSGAYALVTGSKVSPQDSI